MKIWKYREGVLQHKDKSQVIHVVLEGLSLMHLQNTKFLLTTLKYLICSQSGVEMSAVQKSVPQSELLAVATHQHFSLSLAFALQPCVEMVLLNRCVKPEGEAEKSPGFFYHLYCLSEYASVLVPCY